MEIDFTELVGKKVLTATKLSGGINNPTYKLICCDQSKFIIQFSGEKYPDKAMKQPLIVSLLKDKTNLPIANIIKSDTTKELVDKDYIILEFIEGNLLKDISDNFTNKEIIKLYQEIAKYLSSLHSIKLDSFGEFTIENGSLKITNKYDSAKEQIYEEYQSWINQAKETPFEHFIPSLTKWLKNNINVFGEDIDPCLTHNDFSNTNMLVLEDGTISAIIDLDNISPGNNVTDIYRIYANFNDEKKELALKTFFKNYKVELPKNFEKQIKFYEITHVLAYIECWKQILNSYTEEELKKMIKKMNADINKLLKTKLY